MVGLLTARQVADMLRRLGLTENGVPSTEPRRCRCDRPWVFETEEGGGRCYRCGREPRR
jgi:hypothetical protein